MCVLTFIPTRDNGFILTSNRDETVFRQSAIPPKKYNINGQHVFFPKDPQSDGTWIASSGDITLCLLNGGFIRHIPRHPYRQSRGKVIPDFFNFQTVCDFTGRYDFSGIEPFTLIIINNSDNLSIDELRWDGMEIFRTKADCCKPHIWSSVTLYSPQMIQKREQWFNDFLHQPINSEKMLEFHLNGGFGDIREDIRMNRDNVLKTISTTQYVINQNLFTIYYEDLIAERRYNFRIVGK